MDRREFSRVLGLGALAVAAGNQTYAEGAPRQSGPVKPRLRVLVRGGYVYVIRRISDQIGRIEFGPIARPQPHESNQNEENAVYERHDLLLGVVKGTVASQPQLPQAVEGLNVWNLSGATVAFAGSQNGVKLPPAGSNGPQNWNDLNNLPNIVNLARNSTTSPKLMDKPEKRLNGRVLLTGGEEAELRVLEPRILNPETRTNQTAPKLRYVAPDGTNPHIEEYASDTLEFSATLPTNYVDINIVRPPAGEHQTAINTSIRVAAVSFEVNLVISAALSPFHYHAQGKPIPHFAMFYRLLKHVPNVKRRPVPHLSARSPGIFCPPGAFLT